MVFKKILTLYPKLICGILCLMNTITISKKEYESLKIARRQLQKLEHIISEEAVNEEDVLRWSKEARRLKKGGKLPLLKSLKDFR